MPTGPPFSPREVPGGDPATYVASRFHGNPDARAGERWPCEGTVILHVPASAVAPYLAEGLVEPLGPDRCRVVMGAWSWAGLAATIASADADIDAVTPAELARAFAQLGRRAMDAAGSFAGSYAEPTT